MPSHDDVPPATDPRTAAAPPADRPPLRVAELPGSAGAGGAGGGRWAVEVVAASPSTNVELAARARAGGARGAAGSVLVAEHQTAGRGRIDRTFTTPDRAALTVSALLRPQVPAAHWPWLPLLAGLAVREAVTACHPGVDVALKWPNDVLVPGRDGAPSGKLCGILVERVDTPEGPAAVVGIGLNATTTADELPVPTAASLVTAGVPAAAVDRTALLLALLDALERWLRTWESGDVAALRSRYAEACSTVGQAVRVELPADEVLRGTAVGVDPAGCLVVDDGARRHVVSAGDVVHVRPGA